MPESVTRDELRRLIEEGAQVVDVLPAQEYEERHIAGAVGIPLRELAERAPRELDPSRPVVTYCNDFL